MSSGIIKHKRTDRGRSDSPGGEKLRAGRLRCDGMLEEWVNLAALARQTDICLDFLQLLSEKDKGGTEHRITEPTSGQKLILWFPN